MCANRPKPRHPGSWREGLRNFITNWDQPLPFHVKVSRLARNLWMRAAAGSTCCGHDGEPGC